MTVRYADKAARDLESLPRNDRRRILDAPDRAGETPMADAVLDALAAAGAGRRVSPRS